MPKSNEQHWLSDVASHAGLSLSLPADPSMQAFRRAWSEVARASGTTEEGLVARFARHFRIEVADLRRSEPTALQLVPEAVARRHGVLPLRVSGDTIVVASADPVSRAAREDLAEHSGRRPVFELAAPGSLLGAIDRSYPQDRSDAGSLQQLVAAASATDFQIITSVGPGVMTNFELEAPAVVELTRKILEAAVRFRASGVDFEPGSDGGRVRFRVDGVLQHFLDLPAQAYVRTVARLKNVLRVEGGEAEHRHGARLTIEGPKGLVEARVLVTDGEDGERVAVRLLDPPARFALDRLALMPVDRNRVDALLENRDGIVLITGPARSGKTTFIYAALNAFNDGKRSIATLENPIDVRLPGISQNQYDPADGPFADVLQRLLNLDPEVVYAGELRDLPTARTVVRTGVTGRLVFASVHTPDALTGLTRLVDLGIEPARLAESLRGVVSLRLVRRLCRDCARPTTGSDDLPSRERRLAEVVGVLPPRFAVGCPKCLGTGYRALLVLPEILLVTGEVREALERGGTPESLEKAARSAKMRPFEEGGLEWVRGGETSLQEIERVVGFKSPAGSPSAPGPVLVVDDSAQDRLLIRTVLKEFGFRVVEAEDGARGLALASAEEHDFSLALLDLNMPEMDGLELLGRIRGSVRTAALPVIVLTGSDDPADEIALLERGADDYLRKPVDPARLGARVRAVLRRAGVSLRR